MNPELTGSPSPLDVKAKRLAQAISPRSTERQSAALKIAKGLGWFSIGLGLFELLATRRVARATGLQGHEGLVRACGLRELASGVAILSSQRPGPNASAVGARAVGDALDLSLLGAAAVRSKGSRARPVAAMAAVAGVAALDLACAQALRQQSCAARQTTDYSDRCGIAPSRVARESDPALSSLSF